MTGLIHYPSLLLVAYHFPPVGFSSGVHRTLCFANDLLDHGWHPTVLTVTRNAYPTVFSETLERVRPELEVVRCPALDSARHLALFGHYPRLLALPDRWSSWIPSALVRGLAVLRRRRSRVIWSTYPIASAHLIGYLLHRLSGLPWIADFRDPMYDQSFPVHPWYRRLHQRIEGLAMRHADKVCVTTHGTARLFEERYPRGQRRATIEVIANGFDHVHFQECGHPRRPGTKLTLLHSGLLDPADRPLEGLLKALKENKGSPSLELRLRASGHDEALEEAIARHKIADRVQLLPSLPYQAAVDEMRAHDLLILIQGESCPHQIPAKAYEYLRSGRPILGLCEPGSETDLLLAEAGIPFRASPGNSEAINEFLSQCQAAFKQGKLSGLSPEQSDRYDRQHRSRELAELLHAYR